MQSGNRDIKQAEVFASKQMNGAYSLGNPSKGEEFEQKDPNIVTWDGPDDPANPLNWSKRRKYIATFLVASITLMPGMTSSISGPATPEILRHFHNSNATVGKLLTSIMLIVWGFAGIIIAPLSEVIGRKWVFVGGAFMAMAFDMGCAWAPNMAALLVFRAFSGMFNIPPLVIGAGCMADLYIAEERLWPLAWWGVAPSLGPVMGPLCGAFIAQWGSWRWTFLAPAISQGAFGVLMLLFFDEVHAPVLLNRKTKKLRKSTGNKDLHTIWEVAKDPLLSKLKKAVARPILYLGTNPIVFGLGLFIAFVYALIFLVLTTFSGMWQTYYHYPIYVGGLLYIGLGVGMVAGTFYWTAIMNHHITKRRREGRGVPEDVLFYLPLGGIQMSVGVFWYGWSAQARVHWIMAQIGMFLFGGGIVLMFQAIQPYIVMLNPRFASSAVSALVIFRCELACAFPLFGQQMYDKLGYGWANTMIGLLLLLIGVPFPLIVLKNGARMRTWVNEHTFIQ